MSKAITDLLYANKHLFTGDKDLPASIAKGKCSLCQELNSSIVPLRRVVSQAFTEWDVLSPPYNVCLPCGWVLSNKGLRLYPVLITKDSILLTPCPHKILGQSGAEEEICLIAPISKQKQLAHHAEYGSLVTDIGSFPLSQENMLALSSLETLRTAGFNEAHLKEISSQEQNFPVSLFNNPTRISTLLPLLDAMKTLQSRNPDLYQAMILLSRSTYCTTYCPGGLND